MSKLLDRKRKTNTKQISKAIKDDINTTIHHVTDCVDDTDWPVVKKTKISDSSIVGKSFYLINN